MLTLLALARIGHEDKPSGCAGRKAVHAGRTMGAKAALSVLLTGYAIARPTMQ